MKRKYDEKLVEDVLRDYPYDFLGEHLKVISQQQTIGGFRPDLIFEDVRGLPVIVEVQLKALDRSHLYRSLEYRDLYKEGTGTKDIRVILFCNRIPSKYEKVLSAHGVDCIKIGKKEFLNRLHSIAPKIKVVSASWDKKISSSLTSNSLLREIQKAPTENNNLFAPDTLILWIAWGSFGVNDYRLSYPLAKVYRKSNGFIDFYDFKDRSSRPVATVNTQFGPKEVCLPLEIFACAEKLENIDYHHFNVLETLLDLIYDFPREKSFEISLGSQKYYDPFGWGSYIEGRKRKLFTLCDYYSAEEGYDIAKIQNDLELLLSIKIYSGKYPNFIEEQTFKSYEIISGPGSQREFFEIQRENLIRMGYEENLIQKFDLDAQKAEKEWVTVQLNDVSGSCKEAVIFLLHHVKLHTREVGSLMKQCDRCVAPPRKANEIPKNALKLASKFFWHLKPSADDKVGLQ